jgi:hypothetical protein
MAKIFNDPGPLFTTLFLRNLRMGTISWTVHFRQAYQLSLMIPKVTQLKDASLG